jgi:MFS family permease
MLSAKVRAGFYASVFVSSLGLGLYLYFVPIFAQVLGANFLDLGYIGTSGALIYAIAPFFIGQLADRMSRRILYAAAILINFAATLSLAFSTTVNEVIIIRALAGLGLAFFWPITETLVLDLSRKEERVKEMGRYSISWGSAFLIGPFLGGIIIQTVGYFALFMASSALSLISLVGVVALILPRQNADFGTVTTPRVRRQFNIVRRLFPWFCLLVCYGLIFGVVSSIFPGYANSVGLSAVLVGVLFTAFGIARLVGYAYTDRYVHFGERKALGLSSLLLAVASVLIILFPTFLAFLIALAMVGGCFAVIFPLSIGLISRHFSESELGAAVGLYESIWGVGTAIGPILAGVLATILDIRVSFVTCAIAGLFMMVIAAKAKTFND